MSMLPTKHLTQKNMRQQPAPVQTLKLTPLPRIISFAVCATSIIDFCLYILFKKLNLLVDIIKNKLDLVQFKLDLFIRCFSLMYIILNNVIILILLKQILALQS
jgi:hypothetical protein